MTRRLVLYGLPVLLALLLAWAGLAGGGPRVTYERPIGVAVGGR